MSKKRRYYYKCRHGIINAPKALMKKGYRSATFNRILELFFLPILTIPELETISMDEKLEMLFDTDKRQIITFVSNRAFTIPGFVPYPERPGNITFRIQRHDTLWVRVDLNAPDAIDIESAKNNVVYRLTSKQYASILNFIERVYTDAKGNKINRP